MDDHAMGLATQFPTLEFKFASFLKKALSNKQDEEDNLGHHYPPPPPHRLLEWMESFPQFGWLMNDKLGQPILPTMGFLKGWEV
jgi:hypothetical protein